MSKKRTKTTTSTWKWTMPSGGDLPTVPAYLDDLLGQGTEGIGLAIEQLEFMSEGDRVRYDGIMKTILRSLDGYKPGARRRLLALARRIRPSKEPANGDPAPSSH